MIATDAARGAAPYPAATLLSGSGRQRQGDIIEEYPVPEPLGPAANASTGCITVLIAASGFKESLGPRQVAAAIAEGVHAAIPSARVMQVPIFDSCEGFTEEMVRLSAGTIEWVGIVGPHGEPVTARLGLIGPQADRTAVIEIEEAVELRRLPPDRRDPTCASSRGAGQLIVAALDRGVRRVIVGCADSGANDGGIGMATALGVRFIDASRTEITEAGGLQRLEAIDMSHRDRRLDDVSIEAVVNPCNDLLGVRGVTRVYGPRKGASPAQVLRLENGLAKYADVIRRALGIDVAILRGGGASGGLGAGLVAFAGARLTSRLDFLQHCLGLESSIATADLVITAEDRIEASTEAGEAAAWIAQRATARGLPVIALTGQVVLDADQDSASGIDALTTIATEPCSRDEALARTGDWLRDTSARAMRRVLGGLTKGYGGNMTFRLQAYRKTT